MAHRSNITAEAEPALPPRKLRPADWQVIRPLWVGALCSVSEVRLHASGQHVALKQLHREHLGDPGLAARCLNEAFLLEALTTQHAVKGLPQLLAVGQLPSGVPGLLLSLLGDSLARRVQSPHWPVPGSPASLNALCHLGEQLATTLSAVHESGVVHRDLRPDNILFGLPPTAATAGWSWDTYLIDFGLAKVAPSGEVLPISTGEEDFLGTEEYMAPEQWQSAKHVDAAADVYSLGVVLYQLATGHLPFAAAKSQILMYQHLVTPPPPLPPYLPRELSRLLLAMLAKRRTDRPPATTCAQHLRGLRNS